MNGRITAAAFLLAACTFISASRPCLAADATGWPESPIVSRVVDVGGSPIGEIAVGEQVVIRLRAPVGEYDVAARTTLVAERLSAALMEGVKPDQFGVASSDGDVTLTAAGKHLVVVDSETATGAGGTPLTIGVIWLTNIRQSLGWNPATDDRAQLASRDSRVWNGVASWYGADFQGHGTASGEPFDMNAYTAAHKTLPFGTQLLVTSLDTGLSVIVRINDRGPFIRGREIDLSRAAAAAIGLIGRGVGPVRIEVIR